MLRDTDDTHNSKNTKQQEKEKTENRQKKRENWHLNAFRGAAAVVTAASSAWQLWNVWRVTRWIIASYFLDGQVCCCFWLGFILRFGIFQRDTALHARWSASGMVFSAHMPFWTVLKQHRCVLSGLLCGAGGTARAAAYALKPNPHSCNRLSLASCFQILSWCSGRWVHRESWFSTALLHSEDAENTGCITVAYRQSISRAEFYCSCWWELLRQHAPENSHRSLALRQVVDWRKYKIWFDIMTATCQNFQE